MAILHPSSEIIQLLALALTLTLTLLTGGHAVLSSVSLEETQYGQFHIFTTNISTPILLNGIDLLRLIRDPTHAGSQPFLSACLSKLGNSDSGSASISSTNTTHPLIINGVNLISAVRTSEAFHATHSYGNSDKLQMSISANTFGSIVVNTKNITHPLLVNHVDVMGLICTYMTCPAGQYRHNCSGSDSGRCTDCPVCPNGMFNSMCSGTDSGRCVDCASCPSGFYREGCLGGYDAGECVRAKECDQAYEYELAAPTATTDRDCAVLRVCNASQYETVAPTVTTNRECAALRVCGLNEYESTPHTSTTDRTCSEIPLLDCADPASRKGFASASIRIARQVDNCCCDEFQALTRVTGDVNVRSNETKLVFGNISAVGGDVRGVGRSTVSRGSLQLVDFGLVTGLSGLVDLEYNQLSSVDFGRITTLGDAVYLHYN
eukprot:m.181033 g.181033  ORF g.181033 m.181033 type:complete len:434 (-) comp16624_c2_seq2:569-1870(-)